MTVYKCDWCGKVCSAEDTTIIAIEHYVNEDDTLYLKICPECEVKFHHWGKSAGKEIKE